MARSSGRRFRRSRSGGGFRPTGRQIWRLCQGSGTIMRLRLSPCVPGDLEEIAEYIAQDSPRHATRMLHLLRARMKEIARNPKIFRLRPEIGAEARLATVGNYVILFRIRQNAVRIERVVHGSRDLLPMLEKTEG